MSDLKSFVDRLGGLHDAIVRRLTWLPESKTLELEIDDLCSNFKGLPEYPGAVRSVISIGGIERLIFDIDTNEERLKLFEFEVQPEGADKYRASLLFWPSGRATIVYRFAEFPEVNLRASV